MTNAMAEAVDQLEAQVQAFRVRASAETAEAHVRGALEKFDAFYAQVLAPHTLRQMRVEHEKNIRVGYDDMVRAEAAAVRAKHAEVSQGIATTKAALRRVGPDGDAHVSSAREMSAMLRFKNRPVRDLLQAYVSTPDAVNQTLVSLIENDPDAFGAPQDGDSESRQALQRAIATRQAARVPEAVTAAETRAAALVSGIGFTGLLQHWLEDRRGVATAPSARLRSVK